MVEGDMLKSIVSGCAVVALAASATSAAAQNAYVAVEGGLACSTGKTVIEEPGVKLGDNGCGGRGTIEVGRTGAQLFGILDHWALRGRLSETKDKSGFVDAGTGVDISFRERRTVLDAEVGAKTPFGMFGGVSRLTVGLRYGVWAGDLNSLAVSGPGVGDTAKVAFESAGFGPRIGLRSSIPLGTHWMYESAMGASALFSSGKARAFENGVLTDQTSRNGTVYSIDSVSLLSYKLNGTEAGSVISVGIASDYYFNQVPGSTEKVNRYSFGPVARFRMPLQ
jgi:hypothetical protein